VIRTATIVFAVAFAVHAAALVPYRSDPFYEQTIADATSYHEMASRIATDGLGSVPVFHQAPLFPVVLSWLYRAIDGADARAFAAHLLSALLGSAAIALLVPIGRAAFGSVSAGIAAAAAAILHAPFIYYDLKLLPVSIALATQAAALVLFDTARSRPGPRASLVAGAAWGIAALARAECLLFVPLGAVGLARGSVRRAGALAATLFCAGVALGILPATIHNLRRGDFVLVASSAGENLFLGNQRGATGGHTPLAPGVADLFSQRAAAEAIAERELGRPASPSQVSSFWAKRAVHEIAADPAAWVGLVLRKLGRALHPGDPSDLYPFAIERSLWLEVLWLLPVSTACFLLLCGVGSLLAWRHGIVRAWPVAALAGVNLAAQLVFFTDSRLRIPFLFSLAPFGGYAAVATARAWRAGKRALPLALGVAVLVAAVGGAVLVRPGARDAVRTAAVLSTLDRTEEALEVLAPFLETASPDPAVLDHAGWLRQKRGELDLARALYLRALERGRTVEGARQTRSRLAAVCERLGRFDEARHQHDLAVDAGDPSAGALVERGRFLERQGDLEGARRDFERARALSPR
jgi:hypothetical protein